MNMIKRLDSFITRLEEFILSFSILAMAAILCGNVVARSIFNSSWTFAEEVGQFLVVAVTFIGVSYGARKGRHISMSALLDLSPYRVQKILVIIIAAVTSAVMFLFAYLGIKYAMKVHQFGSVSSTLRVPMYLVVSLIPIGFTLGGIQYLRNLFINLKEKEVYLSTEKLFEKEESSGSFIVEEEVASDLNGEERKQA